MQYLGQIWYSKKIRYDMSFEISARLNYFNMVLLGFSTVHIKWDLKQVKEHLYKLSVLPQHK